MAEPTPARPGGSAPMIEAVAGAISRPIPVENTHWLSRIRPYPVSGVDAMRSSWATTTTTSPPTIGARGPKRATIRGVRLATTMRTAAKGTVRMPAARVP